MEKKFLDRMKLSRKSAKRPSKGQTSRRPRSSSSALAPPVKRMIPMPVGLPFVRTASAIFSSMERRLLLVGNGLDDRGRSYRLSRELALLLAISQDQHPGAVARDLLELRRNQDRSDPLFAD